MPAVPARELDFFIANQDELVRQHHGKYLVLKGAVAVGVHDSLIQAYLEAQKEHELGSVMIQRCIPGEDAYTAGVASPFNCSFPAA